VTIKLRASFVLNLSHLRVEISQNIQDDIACVPNTVMIGFIEDIINREMSFEPQTHSFQFGRDNFTISTR